MKDTVDLTPAKVRAFLSLHSVCNAMLVFLVAVTHTYSPSLDHAGSAFGIWLVVYLIFLEALVLTLPGWLLGALVAKWLTRVGLGLGFSLIALTPIVYFGDLLSYRTIGEHLFSMKTWEMLGPVVQWLPYYTSLENFSHLLPAALVYASVQVAAVLLWRRFFARLEIMRLSGRMRKALIGACVVGCLPLPFLLRAPRALLRELIDRADRHPICASGWIRDRTVDSPAHLGKRELKMTSRLFESQPALRMFEGHYGALSLVKEPQTKPDIVVLLIESLRHDALTPKAAPNLTALAKESIVSRRHFSGGCATQFGFFSLLYGLDPVFYSHVGEESRPAMLTLLKQAGYHRVFLGTGEFEWMGMNQFMTSDNFDLYREDTLTPYNRRDEWLIDQAARILRREGPHQEIGSKPVFVLLYLYSTHFDYAFSKEDEVFTPFSKGMAVPPWDSETLRLVGNRYANSVHCIDRLVAPLLDRDRIILAMGDHGESMGADGKFIHANSLSFEQVRTPLIVHIPNRPPGVLPGPTSHTDVLPTLLDALGASVDRPELFSGVSLFHPDAIAARAPFSARCRLEHVLIEPSPLPVPSKAKIVFRCDPWRIEFAQIGAIDEFANPVSATPQDEAEFESEFKAWLEAILECDTTAVDETPFSSLTAALESQKDSIRRRAIEVLRQAGPSAEPAVPALQRCLDDNDPKIRKQAMEAIWAIRKGTRSHARSMR